MTAKNGISSVELGRRLGVKAADGLGREAQDHGNGDGAARGGDAAYGAGRDGRRLSRRGALRRLSGAAARRARRQDKRGGNVSTSPEGRPRKLKLAPVKRLPHSARSRVAPSLAGPRRGGCDGRLGLLDAHSTRSPAAIRQFRTESPRADRRPASRFDSNGSIRRSATSSARSPAYLLRKLGPDHAGREWSRQFRLVGYNRRSINSSTMIPRFVHSAVRTEPMPYRLLIAR